jgi:hypothetical protein
MYRGTTPTIVFNVDTSLNLQELEFEQIWVTFKSKIKELTYSKENLILEDGNIIKVIMPQEDTLLFNENVVEAQLRFLLTSGQAFASNIVKLDVNRILKDGVING